MICYLKRCVRNSFTHKIFYVMEFRVSSTAPAKFHMSFSPKKEVNRKENTVGKIAKRWLIQKATHTLVTICYLKRCVRNGFTQYSFCVMESRVSSICTCKISCNLCLKKRSIEKKTLWERLLWWLIRRQSSEKVCWKQFLHSTVFIWWNLGFPASAPVKFHMPSTPKRGKL